MYKKSMFITAHIIISDYYIRFLYQKYKDITIKQLR